MSEQNIKAHEWPDGIDLEKILKELEGQERHYDVALRPESVPHLFLTAALATKVEFQSHQLRHTAASSYFKSLKQRKADKRLGGQVLQ